MNVTKFIYFIPIVLFLNTLPLFSWQLKYNQNGITVYTRKVTNSSVPEYLGTATINANLKTITALILDHKNYGNWFLKCKHAKLIKKVRDNKRILWMDVHLPWPLKDRDAYVYLKAKQKRNKTVIINFYNKWNYGPAKNKYLRLKKFDSFILLKPIGKNKTKIVYQAHLEPGGWIPSWLVKLATKKAPYYTLLYLKKNVRKKKYLKSKMSFIRN